MAVRWLFKTEPSEYSWDDLVRERRTVWSGVKNPTALIHLRAMRKGDRALLYHTGTHRTAVGLVRVLTAPYPDPGAGDPKRVVVDLAPDAPLPRPIPLAAIRREPGLADWDLLRITRLSVVPVNAAQWRILRRMAGVRG